jgi:SAM-dependent methyltransferase
LQADHENHDEPDWAHVVKRFGRDRIPFLESLVNCAARRIDLRGGSTLVCDGLRGCISIYVASLGCNVTACVDCAGVAGELTSILSEEGVSGVSIAAQVRGTQTGTVIFPFLDNRFDAAVVAVGVVFTSTTRNILRETARALRYGGRIALIVWTFPRPSAAWGPIARRHADERRTLPVHDWVAPFADYVRSVSLRIVTISHVTMSCSAPNSANYIQLLRARVLRNPGPPHPLVVASLGEPEGPVPLKASAALIVAERVDLSS